MKPSPVYLLTCPTHYALLPENLDGMDRRLRSSQPPVCPHCGGFCYGLKAGLAKPPICKPRGDLKGTEVYIVRLIHFNTLLPNLQKKVQKDNPGMQAGYPLFYVGMTRLRAIERLHNHFIGYRASKWVRDYGCGLVDCTDEASCQGLLPESLRSQLAALMRRSGFDGAARELEVATLLRSHGYAVISN